MGTDTSIPKKSHPDEPNLVLLGSDPLAPDLALLCAEGHRFLLGDNHPQVSEDRKLAQALSEWCIRSGNTPVHVLTLLPLETLLTELRRRETFSALSAPLDDDPSL